MEQRSKRHGISSGKQTQWTHSYRNRALVLAFIMSVAGLILFVIAGTGRETIALYGVVFASFLYIMNGMRYWQLFQDLLILGAVNELTFTKRSVLRDMLMYDAACILIFIGLTITGIIPGAQLVVSTAFYAGFAIIGWYHLAMVFLWEHVHRRGILTDGPMLYAPVAKKE